MTKLEEMTEKNEKVCENLDSEGRFKDIAKRIEKIFRITIIKSLYIRKVKRVNVVITGGISLISIEDKLLSMMVLMVRPREAVDKILKEE
jgi:hypothetical protein